MNRTDALYKVGIPCVIFFKLKSPCQHCDNFMPIWQRLCTDPDFKGKLAFIIHSFGQDPLTKKVHRLIPEYQDIIDNEKGVPAFVIHLPHDGDIIDLGNGPIGPDRKGVLTFDAMKHTIIRALSDTKYAIA